MTTLIHSAHRPEASDRLLGLAAFTHASIASLAAAVSIQAGLPAEFLGHVPTTTPLLDFVLPTGWGTAMAPPLSAVLLLVLLGTMLLRRQGPLLACRIILTVLSTLFIVGILGEPYSYVALSDLSGGNHLHQLLIVAMFVSPVTLFVRAVQALARRGA